MGQLVVVRLVVSVFYTNKVRERERERIRSAAFRESYLSSLPAVGFVTSDRVDLRYLGSVSEIPRKIGGVSLVTAETSQCGPSVCGVGRSAVDLPSFKHYVETYQRTVTSCQVTDPGVYKDGLHPIDGPPVLLS